MSVILLSLPPEPKIDGLTLRVLGLIAAVFTTTPAFAQGDIARAPMQLVLQVPDGTLGERCRQIETADALVPVSLRRTFHDDFDTHPLSGDRWVPHYAGGAAWPGRLGIAAAVVAPGAGFLAPDIWVSRRFQRRARAAIRDLPDMLDQALRVVRHEKRQALLNVVCKKP